MKTFALFSFIGLIVTCGVLACSSLGKTPDTEILTQVAVQYATGKVIEVGHTPGVRADRALRIAQVASAVQAVAKGDQTTLAALQAAAMTHIGGLNLNPSDALLASSLVNAIVAELSAKISSGVLKPDDLVVINKVLSWVQQACALYPEPTPVSGT